MKKILRFLIIMLMFSVAKVSAAGNISVSTSSLNMTPGSTKTFKITASNAAGRIDISSSDTNIATVSSSSLWIENETITITVKAKNNEGVADIIIKLSDAATFDGEVLSGNKVVKVIVKNVEADKTNANLSSLTIKGYDINFSKNTYNYSLEVPNNVTTIDINAKTASSAAKFIITGDNNLKLGLNKFIVKVTAGNGTSKEYTIDVIRKDDIPEGTIENIEDIINNTTKDTIAIKLTNESLIDENVTNTLKSSNKNIIINKYDENVLMYSLSLTKEEMKNFKEINALINLSSNVEDEIKKVANYSEGIYLDTYINAGILKINVKDIFVDKETINLYSYNNETKKLSKIKTLTPGNSLLEYNLGKENHYLLTKATLNNDAKNSSNENSNVNYYKIITIVETTLLIALGTFTFIKVKPIKLTKKK